MTDASATTKTSFRDFPRPFWVINGIELLERGAYYSLAPIFAIFMMDVFRRSGMGDAQAGALAGALTAVNMFLLYVVPLFSAALSEKYGYRAGLVASFALLIAGYGTTLVAGDVITILVAAILIGFGAGIFKPIAAAVVSRTTTEAQRNAGFAIYYGCINLGAFIFPTAVAAGAFFRPDLLVPIAFGTAAALSVVNLVLVLLFYRNIAPPRHDLTVWGAFASLADVFKHPAFLVLIVIYSGFWFMYALNLSFLPAYMVDFARMPLWFAPTLVVSLNALVIILGAPLIGVLTTRFHSLTLMAVGIAGYALSLLIIGWSGSSLLFLGGIVAFSVFELVTHPSYLAYVSKIAPPEKVSIYLGYGFLPIAAGLTIGSSVGGALYGRIALEGGLPARFWAIIAAVGLGTVALLLVYNTVLAARRAPAEGAPVAQARRSRAIGLAGGPAAALVALALIPALVMGAALMPSDAGPDGDGLDAAGLDGLAAVVTLRTGDTTAEGSTTSLLVTIPQEARGNATFTLAWDDEAPGTAETNAPDRFRLHVTSPDGTTTVSETVANAPGGHGEFTVTLPALPGGWTVAVELVDAGDRSIVVGPLAIPGTGAADTGNSWLLQVMHEAVSVQ